MMKAIAVTRISGEVDPVHGRDAAPWRSSLKGVAKPGPGCFTSLPYP